MTCKDAKRILSNPLEAATRAERAAVCDHMDICSDCERFLFSAERPRSFNLTTDEAIQLAVDDSFDPEAI